MFNLIDIISNVIGFFTMLMTYIQVMFNVIFQCIDLMLVSFPPFISAGLMLIFVYGVIILIIKVVK